jgi:hypothetical protein
MDEFEPGPVWRLLSVPQYQQAFQGHVDKLPVRLLKHHDAKCSAHIRAMSDCAGVHGDTSEACKGPRFETVITNCA